MLSKTIANMSLSKMVKVWLKLPTEEFRPTSRGVNTLWLRPSDLNIKKITIKDLANKIWERF